MISYGIIIIIIIIWAFGKKLWWKLKNLSFWESPFEEKQQNFAI